MEKHVEHEHLVLALKEALTYGGNDRPILIARIPVICNDIRDIKTNLFWMRWLLMGVITGIGGIFISVIISALTK